MAVCCGEITSEIEADDRGSTKGTVCAAAAAASGGNCGGGEAGLEVAPANVNG